MGAWGHESCSSDGCWDNLWAKDIHRMTQKEADNSLKKAFNQKIKSDDDDSFADQLGAVIWILRQGLKVEKKYLVTANNITLLLLGSHDYLEGWDIDKRVKELKRESKEIKQAIQNGGVGKKKHVPGLMEKIALVMGGK